MRDLNQVKLSGTIFWSKLDDRQSYTILRLGVKLANGNSCFVTVNNPSTKAYDAIKTGNKVVISAAIIDIWEKENGDSELQLKTNDSGILFFPKEKVIADFNSVSVIGKVLSYSGDTATIEMIGERNPKTDKLTIRKGKVRIGDSFGDSLVGSKIMLEGKVSSIEVDGKSKLEILADFDKISIL